MFKKLLHTTLLATLLASIFTLSGCNTVKGFGQDVQDGGEAIERAASK